MKKQELLNLPFEKQEAWVKSKLPDFEMKAYDDTLFGLFCEVSEEDIYKYLRNQSDDGISDFIEEAIPGLSESRKSKINSGGMLSKQEKLAIKRYMAEADTGNDCLGWVNLHGWYFECDDGLLFLVCWGFAVGIGEIHLDYLRAFESHKEACDFLESFDVYSYV